MTGDAERVALAFNVEVIPLIEQPLAWAKIERPVAASVECDVALQMALQANVVRERRCEGAGMDELCGVRGILSARAVPERYVRGHIAVAAAAVDAVFDGRREIVCIR